MNHFNEMKNFLKDMTTDFYHLRAGEIETEELPAHYFNMGYILKQIEESTSMESILKLKSLFLEEFIDHIKSKEE